MKLIRIGRSILNLQNVSRVTSLEGNEVMVHFATGSSHTFKGQEANSLWLQLYTLAENSSKELVVTPDEKAALLSAGELVLNNAAGEGPYLEALQRVVDREKGGQ